MNFPMKKGYFCNQQNHEASHVQIDMNYLLEQGVSFIKQQPQMKSEEDIVYAQYETNVHINKK